MYETVLDGEVEWFPVISLKALKEEVRLLQQSPWRSIKSLVRYAYVCLLLQNVDTKSQSVPMYKVEHLYVSE